MWQKWPVLVFWKKSVRCSYKIGKSNLSKNSWFCFVLAYPGEISMSSEYVFSWLVYSPLRRGWTVVLDSGPWRRKREKGSTVKQPRQSFPLATRKQRNGLSSKHTLIGTSSVMSGKRTISSLLRKSNPGLIQCELEVLTEEKTSWKERFSPIELKWTKEFT